MNETFGTRLRQQRERQQVDLVAISATTKISVALLERLERDDVEHWPVGIFRRAYIRAYATAIGLDPETVLREFLELYPEPAALDPFSAAQAGEDGKQPGTRLGQIVRSAMAAMPGFLQRQGRPELSRMNLAVESADDREPWNDDLHHGPATVLPRMPPHHSSGASHVARPIEPRQPDAPARPTEKTGPVPMPADEASTPSPVASKVQIAEPATPPAPAIRREPDLATAAALCTRFAQVQEWSDVDALLAETANALDAIGLVVWSHAGPDALGAIIGHGYPPAVLARLPIVPRNADIPIATAFRTRQRCIVAGQDGQPGALVVPLLAASGCVGVLALELAQGGEHRERVCAFAEIVAAQLAPLMGATSAAEAVSA